MTLKPMEITSEMYAQCVEAWDKMPAMLKMNITLDQDFISDVAVLITNYTFSLVQVPNVREHIAREVIRQDPTRALMDVVLNDHSPVSEGIARTSSRITMAIAYIYFHYHPSMVPTDDVPTTASEADKPIS